MSYTTATRQMITVAVEAACPGCGKKILFGEQTESADEVDTLVKRGREHVEHEKKHRGWSERRCGTCRDVIAEKRDLW